MGDVYIEACGEQEVLDGVNCLQGRLFILSSVGVVDGLTSLEAIYGSLVLLGDEGGLDLAGLGSLAYIEKDLLVQGGAGVPDFEGLGGLSEIGGYLEVSSPYFVSTAGLETLVSLGHLRVGIPYVQDVPSFVSFDGLGGVTSLESFALYGTGASSLTQLSGIIDISVSVQIVDNQVLASCEAVAFVAQTQPAVSVVKDNMADMCG